MVCFTVGNLLLLSLFTAILLNNFEENEEEDENETEEVKYSWIEQLNYEYIVAFGTTRDKNVADRERQA